MEDSILKSVKKLLNIHEDDTSFDLDVLIFINSAFSTLEQLSISPVEGFTVEDETKVWADYNVPDAWLNMVKAYIPLKVRMLFDPPTTSFVIDALEREIEQQEWRLSNYRELTLPPPPAKPLPEEEPVWG